MEDSRAWLLAGIGGIVAGTLHFAITPDHFAEAAGQGFFFVALGTFQVGWGMWLLGRPSLRGWIAGIAIAFGSILVWLAALFVTAPFTTGTEGIDYFAVFTKLIEALTLVVLIAPLLRNAEPLGRTPGKMAVLVLLALGVGVAGAAASYGAGYGLELVAPGLSEPSEHHHGPGEEHAMIAPASLSAFTSCGTVAATCPQTVP